MRGDKKRTINQGKQTDGWSKQSTERTEGAEMGKKNTGIKDLHRPTLALLLLLICIRRLRSTLMGLFFSVLDY